MKSNKLEVYIVAKAYSGSTVLGRDLSRHSSIFYAGELGRIPAYRKKYRYYQYDAGCMHCLISGTECQIFSPANIKKLGQRTPRQAHDYLRRITGKNIIVDGSKYVDWLNINCQDIKHRQSTRVIILVKNPIDYLHSCATREVGPLWAEANAWRDTYFDAIRTVNRLGLNSMIVRFDQYMLDSQTILRQICSYLGVQYQSSMSKPSSGPLHAIGGNPGAYESIVGKKALKHQASKLDQKLFDINPNRIASKLKQTKLSKHKRQEYLQVLADTPMLLDIANILGFSTKDIYS